MYTFILLFRPFIVFQFYSKGAVSLGHDYALIRDRDEWHTEFLLLRLSSSTYPHEPWAVGCRLAFEQPHLHGYLLLLGSSGQLFPSLQCTVDISAGFW